MVVFEFRTAVLVVWSEATLSCFPDGRTRRMDLRAASTSPDYSEIARWAGYGADWSRYGREHDVTHHWLADRLDWPWSVAIHDGDPKVHISEASERIKWEEHLVNRLQLLAHTGEPDFCSALTDALPDTDAALAELRQLWSRL